MTPIEWILNLPKMMVMLGEIPIIAEVATSLPQQSIGLMFRKSLPANAGMLFVYPVEQELGFHMQNCYIPLDIIFIDANQQIVDIVTGRPMDSTVLNGTGQYVLEVNGGLCDAYGITPGIKVEW